MPTAGAGATGVSAAAPTPAKRSPTRIRLSETFAAGRRVWPEAGLATARISANRRRAGKRVIASADLGQGGLHVVRRLDHLGIHLIGPLRGDEIGDLGHDVDVRGFEIALLNIAVGRCAGIADRRAA